MYRAFILLLTLLALIAIGYFCIYQNRAPAIENDIKQRATQRLQAEGIGWADVTVSGRDITLSGFAPSDEDRRKAESLARVEGYNFVANNIMIEGDMPPQSETQIAKPADGIFSLQLTKTADQKIMLDGVMDEKSHKRLLEVAEDKFSKSSVKDQMTLLDEKAPDALADVGILVLGKLSALNEGNALIKENTLSFSGNSPSETVLKQIQDQLNDELPANVDVAFSLEKEGAASQALATLDKSQCQKSLNRVLKRRVQFNSASSVIKKSSYPVLDQLAKLAKQCQSGLIIVHGHTDSTGRNDVNRRLSTRRAIAVIDYLVKQDLDKSRFRAVGHGADKPIATNKTKRGRARNRRIEITVEE